MEASTNIPPHALEQRHKIDFSTMRCSRRGTVRSQDSAQMLCGCRGARPPYRSTETRHIENSCYCDADNASALCFDSDRHSIIMRRVRSIPYNVINLSNQARPATHAPKIHMLS